MSGNLVGDDTVFDILFVGQAEVLLRGHVAEHGRAVPADHGRADRGSDVVVAGSNIGHEWAERVERGLVAVFDFLFDLLLDLVHGDVAGTFDHDLDIFLPCFLCQFAQGLEFGELRFVAGVGYATGAQAIPEGEAYVIFFENFDDVVEALVEKILFVVIRHPLRQDGSSAADDTGNALGDQRQILDQHTSVNGHVIHALRGLLLNDFQHHFGVQVFDSFYPRDSFVDWHSPNGNWRMPQDCLADLV